MTICTHTTECGPLGEVELTISYHYHKPIKAREDQPGCAEFATIGWIKIGGTEGVEVNVSDDYVSDEIIPACIADWHGDADQ